MRTLDTESGSREVEPRETQNRTSSGVMELVDLATRAFGPPVATPERWLTRDGWERNRLRVWRWPCPVCGAGFGDPIWRPFAIANDGIVRCDACHAETPQIAEAIRFELAAAELYKRLERGR